MAGTGTFNVLAAQANPCRTVPLLVSLYHGL